MPKSKDKTKGAEKRRKSPASCGDGPAESASSSVKEEQKPPAKKRKLPNKNVIDGIEKSKQLKQRLKRPRASCSTAAKRNGEPKLCGNGTPMPTLAELEKMYEDSDSDTDEYTPQVLPQGPSTSPNRCVTPEPAAKVLDGKLLMSPSTLKEIASKVMDMITNVTNNIDDGPRPPVVPPRKPNKSGIPHIVGCKDRKQVPFAPKSSFCKGSPTYGVKYLNDSDQSDISDIENEGPHYAQISKSIFNAQSEEIADRLKELERLESLGIKLPQPISSPRITPKDGSCSPDSNKTIPLDFPDSPKSAHRSFSPLPSTSRDEETKSRNDELFNESLKHENANSNSASSNSTQEDVQIIEVPCETIIIDDTLPDKTLPEPMDVDEPINLDDDCCIIVESESTVKPKRSNSPIEIKDEIYGSLDLTQSYDDNDICEVIDVDDVLAHNQSILNKYKRHSNLDAVILVDSTPSPPPSTRNQNPVNEPLAGSQSDLNENNIALTENRQSISALNVSQHDTGRKIENVVANFFNASSENENQQTTPQALYQNEPIKNQTRPECTHPDTKAGNESDSPFDRLLAWLGMALVPSRAADRMQNRNTHTTGFVDTTTQTQVGRTPGPRPQVAAPDILLSKNTRTSGHNSMFADVPVSGFPQASGGGDPAASPLAVGNSPASDKPGIHLGDCPICMESLSNNPIASTLCGHIFCMNCIKAAFKANGKKCPTCRKTLRGVGYHQLFL